MKYLGPPLRDFEPISRIISAGVTARTVAVGELTIAAPRPALVVLVLAVHHFLGVGRIPIYHVSDSPCQKMQSTRPDSPWRQKFEQL